jgi:hypothetical protein
MIHWCEVFGYMIPAKKGQGMLVARLDEILHEPAASEQHM